MRSLGCANEVSLHLKCCSSVSKQGEETHLPASTDSTGFFGRRLRVATNNIPAIHTTRESHKLRRWMKRLIRIVRGACHVFPFSLMPSYCIVPASKKYLRAALHAGVLVEYSRRVCCTDLLCHHSGEWGIPMSIFHC